MAVGEYISVSSQRDSEMADIEKERVEQAKGVLQALKRRMPCPGPCRDSSTLGLLADGRRVLQPLPFRD